MHDVSSQLRQILVRECPEVSWPTARIDVTRGWGDLCSVDIHLAQPSSRKRDLEDKIRNAVDAQRCKEQPRLSVRELWGT